jgi:hypothetical protein
MRQLAYEVAALLCLAAAAMGCSETAPFPAGDGGGGSAGAGGDGGAGAAGGQGGLGGAGGGGAGMGGEGGEGGGGEAGGAPPMLDSKLFVWGELAFDNQFQVGFLDYPGPVTTTLPVSALYDIVADLSADGTQVAATFRNGQSHYVVEVHPADGSGPGTLLYDCGSVSNDTKAIAFSPDGAWIAFQYDNDLTDDDEIWVVPSAGGAAFQVSPADDDAQDIRWARTADGAAAWLAFSGQDGNGVRRVYTVNVAAALPQPIPIMVTTADGHAWDASGRLYWADTPVVGEPHSVLYRASADGSLVEAVPGAQLTNATGAALISSFAISPDGTRLAFAANAPEENLGQIYVTEVDAAAPVAVSAVQTAADASHRSIWRLTWSPDGTQLAGIGNWLVGGSGDPGAQSTFVVPAEGAAGGLRISPQHLDKLVFTADSGALIAGNEHAIAAFALTQPDQELLDRLVFQAPAGFTSIGFELAE